MGFLDEYDLNNVPEEHPSEEGEYELSLTSCKIGLNKKQKPMITALFTVPADPDAQIIGDYITLPHSDQDERQHNQARRRLKDFLDALGVPSDINQEDFDQLGTQGLTITAYVVQRDFDGRTVNNIRSYSTGEEEVADEPPAKK